MLKLQDHVNDLTNQISLKKQQIVEHMAQNQSLETILKNKDEQLAEKDKQISATVAEKEQIMAELEQEKSQLADASLNKENELKKTIFDLEIELKSSLSTMETLKRDSLMLEQSNQRTNELVSKHKFEKSQWQAALTAKERHLNEAILSIRHEADGTARELYKANLDKKRFQDHLEKSECELQTQVCIPIF